MILCLLLMITFKIAFGYLTADQMAQILTTDMDWYDPKLFYGSVTSYCPFSITPHIGSVQRNETNSYLIYMARDLDTTEILFIHYVSFYENNRSIIHTVKIKTLSGQYEKQFIWDQFSYEGLWFNQYMYFDQIQHLLILGMESKYRKQEQQFDSDVFIDKVVSFTLGGSLKYYDKVFDQQFTLSSFPGKIAINIASGQFELNSQIRYNDICTSLTEDNQMLHYKQFLPQSYSLLIPDSEYQNYYNFFFWAKVTTTSSENQVAYLIRTTVNMQSDFINQVGSNSFVYKYYFENDQWYQYIEFYSYVFPFLLGENSQSYIEQTKQINPIDQQFIESWHYIQVEYKERSLSIVSENFNIQDKVTFNFDNVYQFSYSIFRFYIGGNQYEESTVNSEIAQFTYYNCYDENRVIVQCHYSCKTCGGPFSNQCLSCPDDSNRVFDSLSQTCNCQLWYLDKSVALCYGSNDEDSVEKELYLPLDPRYDQIEPEVICAYGYFKYDNECYQCPSASQEGVIFCTECLHNPDSFFDSPFCSYQWQPYENNKQNVYFQETIDFVNVRFFVLVDEELTPCMDCQPCDPSVYECITYPHKHGNQDLLIQCLYGMEALVDGQCILPSNISSDYGVSSCGNYCGYCFFRVCRACIDQIKYFMSFNFKCLECRIPNCKYCFQYNQYDRDQVTPNQYMNFDFSTEPEDYITACALCFEGFIYDINRNECIQNIPTYPCLNGFINDESQFVCIKTALSSFDYGITEISNCQSYISNCINCLEQTLGMIQCVKCEIGYFLEIGSSICKSCQKKYPVDPELVVDCWEESSDFDNWKFEVQSFFQNFIPKKTPLVISGLYWVQRFGLNQCIENYTIQSQVANFLDICVPTCGSICNRCEQYAGNIVCISCNYQFEEYEILSYFDQQCQICPYPCRLCEPRSLSEIQAINPYFIVNETTISQTHRCLINFDGENTFIEQKTGQVRGKNKLLNARFLIQYSPQLIGDYSQVLNIDFDYLIRRKVSKSVIANSLSQYDKIDNIRAYIFSIENNTQIFDGSEQFDSYRRIYNQTKVVLQNHLLKSENYFLIFSQYGVEVDIQQFKIQNLSYIISPFYLNFLTSLTINQLILVNSTFTSIAFINVTQITYKFEVNIIIENLTIENCTFLSSTIIFIQTQEVMVKSIIINNIIITNSTFNNTKFNDDQQKLNVTQFVLSNVVLQNCTIIKSILFQIPKTYLAEFNNIQVINSQFTDSTFIQVFNSFIVSDFSIEQLQIYNSFLIQCYTIIVDQSSFKFYFFNFDINGLLIDGQIPFLIDQNSQEGSKSIYLKNIKLRNIQEQSSPNYYCLFYLIGDSFKVNDYYNIKDNGFNDFCLYHFTVLEIMNSRIQSQNYYENNYQFLEIQEFEQVTLYNITVVNQSTTNYPIIRMVSTGQKINNQSVIIEQLTFDSNYLLKSQSYSISTLLYIYTDYYCQTIVTDFFFVDNTIQHQLQDFSTISPGLLYIQLYQNSITLKDGIFHNNNIKNTTNSLMFLQSDSINLKNITSVNSNYNDSISLQENYNSIFKPIGGLGYLITSILKIQKSSFQNSLAHNGGCFYIKLKDTGQVLIENLMILNSSSWSMQNDYTQGGSFLVDASSSGLSLKLSNIIVQNTFSRDLGGFLYIVSSQIENYVLLDNILIINPIAQDSSIIYVSFPISSRINQIIINDITISIDPDVLEDIVGLLEFSQIIDSKSIQGMIVVINSNIEIFNLSFTGMASQTVFNLQYNGLLKIKEVNFQNVVFKGSFLFTISNYLLYNYDDNSKNLILISQLRLFKVSSYLYNSFLQISIIQSLKQSAKTITPVKLHFQDIKIINCSCEECQTGLLTFMQSNKVTSIKFENLFFYNNQCGYLGCLYLEQSADYAIDKALVLRSKFIKNKCQFGGALYVKSGNFSVISSAFIQNEATQQGGAIYYNSQQEIKKLEGLHFIANEAACGAAIYLEYSILDPVFYESLYFCENKASNVNNVREQASRLSLYAFDQNIKSVFLKTNQTETVNFTQFRTEEKFLYLPSGQEIGQYQIFDSQNFVPYNINLRLFAQNNLGEKLIDIENGVCSLQSSFFKNNIEESKAVQYITFNSSTQSFDLYSVILTFDPYSDEGLYLLISISCDFIYYTNYNYQFYVRTFPCKVGEYYSSQMCLPCDDQKGFYSMKPKSLECTKADPKIIKSNTANQIELYSGYWRPKYDYIQQCQKNLQACEGGWDSGDHSCAIGYIGALCEECDVYNIMGHGQFYKNTQFECIECGGVVGKIFTSLFIVFLTMLSIMLTVNSAYIIYRSFRGLKLRTKHYDILFRKSLDQSAALIKMIVNYFQILVSIKSFQLNVELQFLDFISFIGNPVGGATYSYDCFLSQQSSIEVIYVTLLLSLLIPIIYYLIYLVLYLILVYFKKVPLAPTIYITALLYIFFYTQPNIIQELSALIANRHISNMDWINKNVSYLYFTQTHKTWIVFCIFPLLIIFGVIIPLLLFLKLFTRRNFFNTDKVRQFWGYIYNDYQKSSYYWEIVRIMQREVIIISLTLNEERIIVKGIIIFLVLLFYYTVVSIQKPYNNGNLNRFEQKCIFICELMIALSCLKYQVQIEKISQVDVVLQILLVLLLILLIIFIISKVIEVYYTKYSERLDNIRLIILKHLSFIPKYCAFTRKYLKLRKHQKQEIYKRFRMIRNLMKNFKSQNHLRSFQIEDYSQFRQASTYGHNYDAKGLITEDN